MSTSTQTAECMGGPQDGRIITVASIVRLPEKLLIPVPPDGVRKHVYILHEQGSGVQQYLFSHTEVRG